MGIKFEIKETRMSTKYYIRLIGVLIFIGSIIVFIVVVNNPLFMSDLEFRQILIIASLPVGILALIIFWVAPFIPHAEKIRSCRITDDNIIIKVPHKRGLNIEWSEFSKIKAQRLANGFTHWFSEKDYILIFEGDTTKKFKFPQDGFKWRTRNKILKTIEKIAIEMNKEFIWEY